MFGQSRRIGVSRDCPNDRKAERESNCQDQRFGCMSHNSQRGDLHVVPAPAELSGRATRIGLKKLVFGGCDRPIEATESGEEWKQSKQRPA
jgi:hypothetical protein